MPKYTFVLNARWEDIEGEDELDAKQNVMAYIEEEPQASFGDFIEANLKVEEEPPEEECKHEDGIEYLKLETVDGEPQYTVKCEDCGRYGIIHLEEAHETWADHKIE